MDEDEEGLWEALQEIADMEGWGVTPSLFAWGTVSDSEKVAKASPSEDTVDGSGGAKPETASGSGPSSTGARPRAAAGGVRVVAEKQKGKASSGGSVVNDFPSTQMEFALRLLKLARSRKEQDQQMTDWGYEKMLVLPGIKLRVIVKE